MHTVGVHVRIDNHSSGIIDARFGAVFSAVQPSTVTSYKDWVAYVHGSIELTLRVFPAGNSVLAASETIGLEAGARYTGHVVDSPDDGYLCSITRD